MWLFDLLTLSFRLRKVETRMGQLEDSEAAVEQSVADLKARVTAHETKDADTAAQLQAQIDALKAGGDPVAVAAKLDALKADLDAFDAGAPTT